MTDVVNVYIYSIILQLLMNMVVHVEAFKSSLVSRVSCPFCMKKFVLQRENSEHFILRRGGLLANMGLNRVGTHLKGPVAVLLVLIGHSEGARQAGRERKGWWGTGKQM